MAYIGKTPSSGIRNRFIYTATAGQTTFSGTDDHSRTLSYTDAEFTDVFLNGVKLDKSDYTATSGTSIVLDEGAAVDDILEVLAFDTFSVFSGEFSQDVTVGGATTMTGDLTVDTDTLHVDSTNNSVGIGTSSPSTPLEVSSSTPYLTLKYSGGTGTSSRATIIGENDDGTTWSLGGVTGSGHLSLTNAKNADIYFSTNNTQRVQITGGGNLNVAAPGSTDIGRLSGSVYSSGERNMYIWAGSGVHYTQISGRYDADGSPVFAAIVSGTTRAEIEANGDFLSATNSYGSTSDETLKENIVASGSQWDDIKAIQVKKFSYIEDDLDAPNMLGVIAQDLEASGMNGLVKTKTKTRPTEDGDEEVVLDDDGNPVTYKTVKYSILYMKAIKALQEAMAKIETLETENTTQATQIADLITRVAALEASE